MSTTTNSYLSIAVVLAALAGWTAASPGPGMAFTGRTPSFGPALALQEKRSTRIVQAPPLQAPAPELTAAPGNPVAVVATSLGDITLELFKDRAPVSVENFLQYVTEGFYSDTVFHRVVTGFMIQGGGYPATLVEKTTRAPIRNEATNGLRNSRGTLGMARQQSLRSGTSQFYVNVADNRMLDHTGYSPQDFGYAVFGRVLSGMEVADRIAAMPTKTVNGMENVPVEPVVIKSITLRK